MTRETPDQVRRFIAYLRRRGFLREFVMANLGVGAGTVAKYQDGSASLSTTDVLALRLLLRAKNVEDKVFPTPDPNKSFDSLLGLGEVKEKLKQRLSYPSMSPGLFEDATTKPIVLYGPPGTGKTSIVKAAAEETGRSLVTANPDNVRSVSDLASKIKEAEKNAPAILFFDEAEAVFPGGPQVAEETKKLVKEALLRFDEGTPEIVVMAAINDREKMDKALMSRSIKIYVGLPEWPARRQLLERFLANVPLYEDVDLDLFEDDSDGLSIRALKNAVEEAKNRSTGRRIRATAQQDLSDLTLSDIKVTDGDLIRALRDEQKM